MLNPTVSVLLPVGREDRYLELALSCLSRQTFKEFDIHILVSPGLEKYVESQIRAVGAQFIYYIHSVRLANLAFALNVGVELSKGEFIARMDSDDMCADSRFEAQVHFLKKHSNCCVVGLRTELINENGEQLRGQRFPFYGADKEIRAVLRRKNPICHPSVMIRRESLEAVGGYRYGNSAEDHELYLRLARNGSVTFANLSSPLFYYRRHGGQLTDRRRAYQAFSDIAGFMLTELIRTKDGRLIVGMFRYHPSVRWGGALFNRVRAWASRFNARR
jgi:glycosyltransferase involved in cell wall biosynthesis